MHRFPNVHTADFASIDDAIEAVVIDKGGARPQSAMLALAGPISGDRVPLTNCPWVVEPKKTVARFGLAEMVLLNDFEAQSLALPELTEDDIEPIGGGTMSADGARVVLGPGTGLGAGALVKARDMWVPVPGEGGHIDLSPVSERDFAIWPHVERTGGRIGAETLLCGSGMVRLYRAVCASDGVTAGVRDAQGRDRGGAFRRQPAGGRDAVAVRRSSRPGRRQSGAGVHADRRRVPGRRHQRQDRPGAAIGRLPRGVRRQVAAPAHPGAAWPPRS